MAKNAYVGINNVAHKVKNMYVGVDGKARKVKKGYVGVNGIARLFYSAKTIYFVKGSVTITQQTGVTISGLDFTPTHAVCFTNGFPLYLGTEGQLTSNYSYLTYDSASTGVTINGNSVTFPTLRAGRNAKTFYYYLWRDDE